MSPDRAAPIVALAVREQRRRADLDRRKRWQDDELGRIAFGIRREFEFHRLEIDEERVGADVVGLQRLAIERRRIVRNRREERAIEDEIAVDDGETLGPHRRHEPLPLLQRDLGIAAALQDEVAPEHAIDQRAAEIRRRLPAVIGAEEFERGERRHELHRRRGVHRLPGLVREQRLFRADFLDDDAHRGERHVRVGEGTAHGRRERGGRCVGLRRREQCGGDECDSRDAPHAVSTIAAVRSTSSANSASVTTYGGMK